MDDAIADDNMAEHNFLIAVHKGCRAADANNNSKLDVGEAGAAVGCDGCGVSLPPLLGGSVTSDSSEISAGDPSGPLALPCR